MGSTTKRFVNTFAFITLIGEYCELLLGSLAVLNHNQTHGDRAGCAVGVQPKLDS